MLQLSDILIEIPNPDMNHQSERSHGAGLYVQRVDFLFTIEISFAVLFWVLDVSAVVLNFGKRQTRTAADCPPIF
jgi:hypothetical protein